MLTGFRGALILALLVASFPSAARADLRTQAIAAAEKERVPKMDWSSPLVTAQRRLTSGKVTGWAPKVELKVYGSNKDGDLVFAELKQGRRKLGKVQCKMDRIDPRFKWERVRCQFDDKTHIKRGGAFSLELTYQYVTDSMETKKTKLGTLKFDVMKYKLHRNTGAGFVVNREAQLGQAYADFYRKDQPYLRITFFYKFKGTERPAQFMGRCFVGGKLIGWKKALTMHMLKKVDSVTYRAWKGNKQQDEIGWVQSSFFVPGIFARDAGQRFSDPPAYVAAHPGKWVCKAMFDGTVIREFSFTVKPPAGDDPDPIIEPHPLQAKLFTGKRHIIAVKLKKGWKHEARHKPVAALKRKAFFGGAR
jgi:hypothetical protein